MEKQEKKFEEKLNDLEAIVKSLENGDIELDKAIDQFKEAISLAASCDKDLKEAEKALTSIVNEDGSLTEFNEE